MTTKSLLKQAKAVNVREAQATLSNLINSQKPSLVLSHGKPVSFLVPYEEMLDLLEMLDELKDKRLIDQIAAARSEYKHGKATPAERLFKKLGK